MKIPNSPSPNLPITKRVVLFVGFILATIHLVITSCANAFDESISHVLGPCQHHNIIIPCTQIISCMANLTFAMHLVITFCANTVFAKRAARARLDCWHATSTADKRPGCSDSPQTLIDGDAVSSTACVLLSYSSRSLATTPVGCLRSPGANASLRSDSAHRWHRKR